MTLATHPVPKHALLQRYVGQGATYTDCFAVSVPRQVGLTQFVTAFYTTPLFRAERLILTIGMRSRSYDRDISVMLSVQADTFSAWRVEARGAHDLLMCDVSGATRSWFAVEPEESGGTKLYFGSVVVTGQDEKLPKIVNATLPLHLMYSKALLSAARRRLLLL